jgi:hypothetical protein
MRLSIILCPFSGAASSIHAPFVLLNDFVPANQKRSLENLFIPHEVL